MVSHGRTLILLLLLILIATPVLNAQDAPEYERILVPIFFNGAGAFGSQWYTSVAVANTGGAPIRFSRAVFEGNPICPAICGCDQVDSVPADSVKQVCLHNTHPAGLLLYMEKNSSLLPETHFGGRIYDASLSADTAGSELKIVRESELRTYRIVLPNIQIGAGYRVALRVFDVRPGSTASVLMRIHRHDNLNRILVQDEIRMEVPADAGAQPGPSHPAYATIADLAAKYPELANEGLVSITLLLPEPLISPPRAPAYWAVASITNNTTQQVTMVTPQ